MRFGRWAVIGALALGSPAAAREPGAVVLPMPDWRLGEATYDHALEDAVTHPDWGQRPFLLPGEDGELRPLWWYDPSRRFPVAPPPEKEPPVKDAPGSLRRAVAPALHPGPHDGALSGKAVYLSQCHGYIYFNSLSRHSTQRGILFDTVEDFHNPEALNAFLAPLLEQAGAAVFTVRERDPSPARAIADDGGPDHTETGAWEAGQKGWATPTTLGYGQDPFDAGTTRRARNGSGAVAWWTPNVPEDGVFGVYVAWDSDPSHTSAAHYRITHPGGVIERTYDQRVHGSTWQYVTSVWLPAGRGGLTVELIADGTDGAWVSADAVRVGGGPNPVSRSGDKVPARLWEMGAVAYTQFNGAPTSVYDPFSNGDGTDPTARSRWAAWEHPAGEDAVYLSWHSNAASTGTARGTSTYYAGGGSDAPAGHTAECSRAAVTGSYTLSRLVQEEMIASFQATYEPAWRDRGVLRACFAEVNPNHNAEMPSALVELAFHDNETDAGFLKDPTFRLDAARAMYRGIVRYFAERDGVPAAYLPEPPRDLSLRHEVDGTLTLSWTPGEVGAPYGDAPTGYLVETSVDGRAWDEGFAVTDTTVALPWASGETRAVRVRATNEAGTSFPSEVIAARKADGCTAPVLVVSAFDRFDAGLLPRRPAPYIGTVVTMDLPRVNPADTAWAHGEALAASGAAFDTVSDELIGTFDLSPYAVVWWVAGEESSVTDTFTPAQQTALRAFLDAGGSLVASGSEILWDLDARGTDSDRAFAAEVLGATLAADSAGTTEAAGEGVLAGVDLAFSEADGAPYTVEFPDVLTPAAGVSVVARYGGGGVAGVLGDRAALFGVPLEAVGDPASRRAVAAALLASLAPGARLAGEGACATDPGDPGGPGGPGAPDTDTGPAGDAFDPDAAVGGARRVALGPVCGCASGGVAGAAPWGSIVAVLILARRRGRRRV